MTDNTKQAGGRVAQVLMELRKEREAAAAEFKARMDALPAKYEQLLAEAGAGAGAKDDARIGDLIARVNEFRLANKEAAGSFLDLATFEAACYFAGLSNSEAAKACPVMLASANNGDGPNFISLAAWLQCACWIAGNNLDMDAALAIAGHCASYLCAARAKARECEGQGKGLGFIGRDGAIVKAATRGNAALLEKALDEATGLLLGAANAIAWIGAALSPAGRTACFRDALIEPRGWTDFANNDDSDQGVFLERAWDAHNHRLEATGEGWEM